MQLLHDRTLMNIHYMVALLMCCKLLLDQGLSALTQSMFYTTITGSLCCFIIKYCTLRLQALRHQMELSDRIMIRE